MYQLKTIGYGNVSLCLNLGLYQSSVWNSRAGNKEGSACHLDVWLIENSVLYSSALLKELHCRKHYPPSISNAFKSLKPCIASYLMVIFPFVWAAVFQQEEHFVLVVKNIHWTKAVHTRVGRHLEGACRNIRGRLYTNYLRNRIDYLCHFMGLWCFVF